jgi:hypothetical protein
MHFSIKAFAAATSLTMASGAFAATVELTTAPGGSSVIVTIGALDADLTYQQSLVLDTGLHAVDFAPGAGLTSWSSNSLGVQPLVQDFMGTQGYDSFRIWAAGGSSEFYGVNKTSLNTGSAPARINAYDTNLNTYLNNLNFGDFGADLDGNPYVQVVDPGDPEGFKNPQMTTWMNRSVGVGDSVPFTYYKSVAFPNVETSTETLGSWSLSAAGEVTYAHTPAVVPLPAAAWLFGSALAGLVAFGRRRAA